MKKTILEIYAMAVCLFAVICFVACLGIAIYAAVGIASPEFTMRAWTYEQHETNDFFWGEKGRCCSSDEKAKQRPGEPELTKLRLESLARANATERRDNYQTLVKTLIIILIDVVVFAFHWRMARRERMSAA